MLTRVYIDNFRSFVNFEYRPGRKQLILGRNGSGKSSLLDALLFIRQFVIRGDQYDLFNDILGQRTRWLSKPEQTYELEVELDGGVYVYRLEIKPVGEAAQLLVVAESVEFDRKPIFGFTGGEVRLYNDQFELTNSFPFDWHRSALATMTQRSSNQRLTSFKVWLAGLYCFRINPFTMAARAEGEDLYPNVNLSNIAAWYRHLVQAHPKENAAFIDSLREALDEFTFLKLESYGEKVRLLVADFTNANNNTSFGFGELSDGQRCLICLYTILHFVVGKGSTVILDEPDNFISLREIQPWLMLISDVVDDGQGQVLLISHHPELINQWAPSYGVRFYRDGIGPTRVEAFHGDTQSSLSPAELVARGWENG